MTATLNASFLSVAGPDFQAWFTQNKSKLIELFTPEVAEELDCPTVEEFGFGVFDGEFEVL